MHPVPGNLGADGGVLRLASARAGPYLVSAWTQPDPPKVGGWIDVSVAVMRPDTRAPVLDAEVPLSAQAGGAETIARVKLERGTAGNLLLYHGELEVPVSGQWRLTLAIQGSEGHGWTAFDLEVLSPRPLP